MKFHQKDLIVFFGILKKKNEKDFFGLIDGLLFLFFFLRYMYVCRK